MNNHNYFVKLKNVSKFRNILKKLKKNNNFNLFFKYKYFSIIDTLIKQHNERII